jgi:hypothetical protein
LGVLDVYYDCLKERVCSKSGKSVLQTAYGWSFSWWPNVVPFEKQCRHIVIEWQTSALHMINGFL